MSLKGILHKIAWVNLETREIKIKETEDEVYIFRDNKHSLGIIGV
jgi:hypothetical protein